MFITYPVENKEGTVIVEKISNWINKQLKLQKGRNCRRLFLYIEYVTVFLINTVYKNGGCLKINVHMNYYYFCVAIHFEIWPFFFEREREKNMFEDHYPKP